MQLKLKRFSDNGESTLGILSVNDVHACFTLEDEKRAEKVWGETRIPAGTYKIKLRREGGLHEQYSTRFPDVHKGMLHLQNVPGFEYILIHIGNDDDDTAGCILVGDTAVNNRDRKGFIQESTRAYLRTYPPIAAALLNNEDVDITIEDD